MMSWLLSSCNCGDTMPVTPASPDIYYHNSKGQDLLDPATAGYIGQSGLTLSFLAPDKTMGSQSINAVLFNSTSTSYLPNGYCLSINPFLLNYQGNSSIVTGNTCVIYIQLSTSDTDTLTFDYSNQTLTKFYFQ